MQMPTARMFVCLLMILGLGLSSSAQTETATLSGRVTDQSGAVVPGVEVEITNDATNISVTTETNQAGLYVFPNLRPGRYQMVVRKLGFKEIIKTDIVLHVQGSLLHNLTLEVGSVAQSITVRGDIGAMTSSPAVGTVVDRKFVENLPLNGRSFQQLIALTPGVVLTKAAFGLEGQFSVNGQRANANYFTVDGASANFGIIAGSATGITAGGTVPALSLAGGTNSLVSVDAMQEFRIQTSTYAAEFGRQPGGQISIVTRSGSNDFHGTLFHYFRNDKLDANDWFANRNGLEKPPLRQNQFGGVLGGPIVPDKTFFFFSYEGLRLRQPQVAIATVPSVASRQAAVPRMQPFFNAYPVPNGPDLGGGWAQFAGSWSDAITLDATSIRIDHSFNDKVTLFGRYNHAPSDSVGRIRALNTLLSTSQKIQTLTLGTTQILTPSVSNELRVNLSRLKGARFYELTDFEGAVPLDDSQMFPSFTSSNNAYFVFGLYGGGMPYYEGNNGGNQQRQINLVDSLSIVTGTHQLKLGVDYRWLSPFYGPVEYQQGVYFWTLANALAGMPDEIDVYAKETLASVFTNFSAYAQDTWRATPRLTLTYGLRWDVNPPPHGKGGKELFVVDQIDDPATTALAPAGTPLYDTTYTNFAPRVGVAYQVSQKPGKETVLRGGFGIFYDLGASRATGDLSFYWPHYGSKVFYNVPFPLDAASLVPPPLPDPSVPPVSEYGIIFDSGYGLPRTSQWNFTLEQSLGSNQTISAAYVAAVGRSLLQTEGLRDINASFYNVTMVGSVGTSDYHALQLQFKRRLSRGLQALASYTWSHSIDTASDDSSSGGVLGYFADTGTARGSSNFDVRHVFSGAVSYNFPTPSAGAVGKAFLRNWSVDTIIKAQSATPVNLQGGYTFVGSYIKLRPDVVPGQPLYLDDPTAPGGRRFNPAAFTAPPPGRQGTLGRNVLRGFPMSQVDFTLRRRFNLTEKLNLQFRVELFNAFNHPNLGDPSVLTIGSPFFGESTKMLGRSLGTGGIYGGFNPLYQVGGPRSIQLALKLVF